MYLKRVIYLIKLISAILIIAGTTYFGFELSNKLKKRLHFLLGFSDAITYIQGEIKYSQTPVQYLFNKINTQKKFQGLKIFNDVMCEKNEMAKALQAVANDFSLTDDDMLLINGFFESFGKSDISSTITLCDKVNNLIKSNISDANNRYMVKGRLYRSMGLFAGTAIVILIV